MFQRIRARVILALLGATSLILPFSHSTPADASPPVAPVLTPALPSLVTANKALLVPYSVVDPTTNETTSIVCADCGIRRISDTQAQATGMLVGAGLVASDVARPVKLQYLSGTTWKTISTKDVDPTTGKVSFNPFSITGFSRWKAKSYRIYAPSFGSASSVKSPSTKFLPGPGLQDSPSYSLGANVLRVSVNNTVYPTSKTTIYKGSLTYTHNGRTTAPIALENFAVRGHGTAKLAKKPYKIKFEKKSDLFDPFNGSRGKDSVWATKRFNLLALFVDNTLVRDRVGLNLARGLDGNGDAPAASFDEYLARPGLKWTSRTAYTELYVNDQYLGVYLITDANKLDATRVNVDKEKGAIVESDGQDITSGQVEWETSHHRFIKFEDPDAYKNAVTEQEKTGWTLPWGTTEANYDPEGITPAKRAAVKSQVQRLENAIYSHNLTNIKKYLDLDSTVDWYLVREFTKDVDADFYRSADFYLPDFTACQAVPADQCGPTGKFYFGPVWDFDRSAGATTKSTSLASTSGLFVAGLSAGYSSRIELQKTQWFTHLWKTPGFEAAVKARWAERRLQFKEVGDTMVPSFYNALTGDPGTLDARAASDRQRWAGYTREYGWRSSTFSGEVNWVKNWYQGRWAYLDSKF